MVYKETAIANAELYWPMEPLLLHSWDDRFEVFLVLKHTDSVCSTVAQLPPIDVSPSCRKQLLNQLLHIVKLVKKKCKE